MKNLQLSTLGLLCLMITTPLFCQKAYSGIFLSNQDSSILAEKLNWQALSSQDKKLSASGFKLVDLEVVHEKNQEDQFYGLWQRDTTATMSFKVPGWDSLVQAKRKMAKQGYVMTDIEAYAGKDKRNHFYCVWEKKKIWHKVWKLDTWEGLVKKNKEMVQQFLYLRDIEAIQTPNEGTKFLAIFHEGDRERKQRTHVFASADLEAFNTDQWQRKTSGYHMIDFESYQEDDKTFYIGVYQKIRDQKHVLRQNFSKTDFDKHAATLLENNFRLTDIEIQDGAGRQAQSSEDTALEQN